MPRINKQAKAAELVRTGRVSEAGRGWQVVGDTRTYRVTRRDDGALRCECPVPKAQMCSHRLAVGMYEKQKRRIRAKEIVASLNWRPPKEQPKMAADQFTIQKAIKAQKKARIALDGPAGSGKTFTALELAMGLAEGGKIGLVDTEKSSADLYADRYDFDTIKLNYFSPQNYVGALEAFAKAGYAVVIVDSWSHAWEGAGGALEMVDEAAKRSRSGNSFTAWREVTPRHNEMVAAILDFPGHVIVTMRTKMEYVLEQDEKGKTTPKKVGMAPIQRGGVEYEFDVIVDMDLDHNFIVSKTRLSCLDGRVIKCPTRKVGEGILADLNSGAVAPPQTPPSPPAPAPAQPAATPPPAQSAATDAAPEGLHDPGPIGGPEDDPFGPEEAPAHTPQRADAPLPDEAQYNAEGTPANAAGQAHSDKVDALLRLEQDAQAVIDAGGLEIEYKRAMATHSGLMKYLIGKGFNNGAQVTPDAVVAAAGYDVAPNELTPLQRLVVCCQADAMAAQRE